ncbi:MAG: TIM barrel protein [Actinomycetota bacterium]|nr:TIM barrel protein [Actinomycetota bacterium]
MLGISTSWLSRRVKRGEEMLRELLSLEAHVIELEYHITPHLFSELRPLLKKEELTVVSIHNFFPVPNILERGSGDAFFFTSDDDKERELAVEYTLRTIRYASELETKVVILHLGNIPLKANLDHLYELHDEGKGDTDEAHELREELKDERRRKVQKYFDRALLSLDKLVPVAEKLGVILGIETRYHYHEIPSHEEIGFILREFEGAPVAYWHDVGHAHNLEYVGFTSQKDFLDGYASNIVGMHLHDAKGREDHFAPGTGDVDFSLLKSYLKEETIKVIEVHPKVSRAELLDSFKFLKDLSIS